MSDDDIKMLEALALHMGRQIDQLQESCSTPLAQILLDELRTSTSKIRSILTRMQPSSDAIVKTVAPFTFGQPPVNNSNVQNQAQTDPGMPRADLSANHSPSLSPSLSNNPSENAATSPGVPPPFQTPASSGAPIVPTENNVAQPVEKKVLFLIDDDKDAQKVLSYMFERKSMFRVVSYLDPLKAWEDIRKVPPDLILMDLMMPGINGLDLLKNIRQIPDLKQVKILIGSSKSFDKDRIEVLKAGANDFIAKPYNFTELLLRLNKLAG